MFQIYVPAQAAEDWKAHLAEPEKHWRQGYSAWNLAYSWQTAAPKFPAEIQRVFAQSALPDFANLEPILGIVEHPVPMPGKGFPSQNDLFVLARASDRLAAIVVEGKVSETFGQTLKEWHSGSENKAERLAGIQRLIGLKAAPPLSIRYQLLHRLASSVVEAKRFNAAYAIMLIHSFSPTAANFEDYRAFIEFYGQSAMADQLIPLAHVSGVQVLAAWIHGNINVPSE